MSTVGEILVIDDEPNALKVISAILSESGYSVEAVMDVDGACQAVAARDFDAVVTDMKLPDGTGMDIFHYVKEKRPDIPVIFLTAYGTVESAVDAMTGGAFYYFIKPPDYVNLKGILSRAVEQRRLKRELSQLRQRLARGKETSRIIGNHPSILRIQEVVEAVSDSESSVLIQGETGTGKEMIARALHEQSRSRRDHEFVAVNCAAIPHELIEAELFGYEKGAFTGATSRRIGRIEQADGGTLFLDEIGELDHAVQAKLLRVLQEKEIERIGGNQKIHLDFRLVSSTNRDLEREISNGNFREDLYYRLNVVQIKVPALRERREDIPLLVSEFVREFCARENKILVFGDEVMPLLCRYDWPGNIRQLRNVIESCVVLSRGVEISPDQLPAEITSRSTCRNDKASLKSIKEVEADAISNALLECRGNKSEAARILGISRKGLYKKIKDFGLGDT
ncbi:sigma-54-dependent transcriptional regulator [Geoalkalibacter subterraneus]|uniref:Chemotaxis protein CheY n=1 Tax=Geoalkalibacter subterraneus TaxID=483547 RepID=A0A0B5FSA0_9BACT|nr:sigma-54 dependent transcriptional regulator [Geoalkalibacter subterraneus]AJF06481.1 chemotaxis protein CheY [Geoalkalibacter subterraneus]